MCHTWLPLLISLWAWRGDDLLELDNVLVVELLQNLDLAYGRDGEAFALVVHADLLERDDLVRLRLLGHVNLPVGALADLLELLEAVDAAGAPRGGLVEVELAGRRHRHGRRNRARLTPSSSFLSTPELKLRGVLANPS
jgi:hypothetical protein